MAQRVLSNFFPKLPLSRPPVVAALEESGGTGDLEEEAQDAIDVDEVADAIIQSEDELEGEFQPDVTDTKVRTQSRPSRHQPSPFISYNLLESPFLISLNDLIYIL
jgi:hypothetical protein